MADRTFQIQKQGAPQVVRRLLGIIGGTFNIGRDVVQPVCEVRSLRPWEEFDEGVIGYSVVLFRAAVVGAFSGGAFSLAAGLPPGSFYTIDHVDNRSAMTVELRKGATLIGFANASPQYTDERFTALTASPPLVVINGDSPAPGGVAFDQLSTTVVKDRLRVVGNQLTPGTNISIVGATANTAFQAVVHGRIILA